MKIPTISTKVLTGNTKMFSLNSYFMIGAKPTCETHFTDCNNRRIVCINGCGELIPLYQKEDHIIECRKKVAKCSYCHTTVKTEMLKSHLKVVYLFIFKIKLKLWYYFYQIQQHHFSCPNASNVCPFAAFGCTYTEKYDVQKHLSEEPIRHLIYLCDELTELKGYYTMIQNDMDGIKSRHSELIQKTISCEEMYGAQLVWRIDNVAQKQNEAKASCRLYTSNDYNIFTTLTKISILSQKKT
uniref:TRAF-type domain-containing protein n=1 Tax=Heterorhabditis bacteriophora TaxID=37862 RepID=A0A1I7WGG4_HETBA